MMTERTKKTIEMIKEARDNKWSDDKIGFEYLKIRQEAIKQIFQGK